MPPGSLRRKVWYALARRNYGVGDDPDLYSQNGGALPGAPGGIIATRFAMQHTAAASAGAILG
jgi:hypothetical protein